MGTRRNRMSIGVIMILAGVTTGCANVSELFHQAMGRNIATQRAEGNCPTISTFTVSPETVRCGDPVRLEIGAATRIPQQLRYTWEIEGQTFETGQRAVWKTPTCKTIDEPERTYTVRGVASSGSCDVTKVKEVLVMCHCAFDVMVNFEFAKANLDATAKTQLDDIAEQLQQKPEYNILIEGHTDYIGSNQSNQRLGDRRAAAVKRYLIRQWNIQPDRIVTRSYGEEDPIAPNETDSGRARNRRAEVFRVILHSD